MLQDPSYKNVRRSERKKKKKLQTKRYVSNIDTCSRTKYVRYRIDIPNRHNLRKQETSLH